MSRSGVARLREHVCTHVSMSDVCQEVGKVGSLHVGSSADGSQLSL